MLDGPQDGILGDFVEHDALGVLGLQSQHFIEVPGDGLSLAVLIGRKPHHVCFLGFLFEFADQFLLLGRDFIVGFEGVGIDAELFLLQVADMTVTGEHFIVLSQKLLDGFSLAGDSTMTRFFCMCVFVNNLTCGKSRKKERLHHIIRSKSVFFAKHRFNGQLTPFQLTIDNGQLTIALRCADMLQGGECRAT